jgi:intracellular multiplication protein IcmL
MADDAASVAMVKHRSDFYRDNYRRVISALLMSIIIIALLAAALFYITTHPPVPQYFATTIQGRITPIVPLDQPNLPPSALLQWANQAAIASYTYNFQDYRAELQAASDFFTPAGWTNFLDALSKSNNLTTVIAKKLVVSAVATGAPIILDQQIIDGIYTWKVQMPMLVSYQSASSLVQQQVMVTMIIQRVSTLSSFRGVGISSLVAQ